MMSQPLAQNAAVGYENPHVPEYADAHAETYDETKLRLDLFKLCERMGDGLLAAFYEDKFGETLRYADNPDVRTEYNLLIGRMASDMAAARKDGKSHNLNWDHPLVRALVADGVMEREA